MLVFDQDMSLRDRLVNAIRVSGGHFNGPIGRNLLAQINSGSEIIDVTLARAMSEAALEAAASGDAAGNALRKGVALASLAQPALRVLEPRLADAQLDRIRSKDSLMPPRLDIRENGVNRSVQTAINRATLAAGLADLPMLGLLAMRGLAARSAAINTGQRIASEKLTPSSFGHSTIVENPEMLSMWNEALKSAHSAKRENGYTRYLEALGRGEKPNNAMLERAFQTVNDRFVASARAAGHDIAEVHHWNFGKLDYPEQIVDPRHLVPVPTRAAHFELHKATSGTTNYWVGPIAAQHRIEIPNWFTPLATR